MGHARPPGGGRMAAAGHDVVFIVRGTHRDAIRREGLNIKRDLVDVAVRETAPAAVTSRQREMFARQVAGPLSCAFNPARIRCASRRRRCRPR